MGHNTMAKRSRSKSTPKKDEAPAKAVPSTPKKSGATRDLFGKDKDDKKVDKPEITVKMRLKESKGLDWVRRFNLTIDAAKYAMVVTMFGVWASMLKGAPDQKKNKEKNGKNAPPAVTLTHPSITPTHTLTLTVTLTLMLPHSL